MPTVWIARNAALIVALVTLGCSDPPMDDDAGPDAAPADAGRDAASDAGVDAGTDAGPPPPGDTCADAIDANADGSVGPDGILRVSATNVAARTDLEACEPIPSSPHSDVVIRYTPPEGGRLHWTLDPEDRNLFFVDLRTTCEDAASTVDCAQCACSSCSSPCARQRFVEAGVPLYFVVSGVANTAVASGMAGFVMGFELEPYLGAGASCDPDSTFPRCRDGLECQDEGAATPVCGVCGDGFVGQDLLACDDGNTDDGDGCSAACEHQAQTPAAATCAAPSTLNVVPTRLGDVLGYAIASGTMLAVTTSGASCASGAGAEIGLAFELDAPAMVEVGTDQPDFVAIRRESSGACDGEELACGGGDATALGITVDRLEAGRYVLVLHRDGAAAGATFEIELGATPL